MLADFSDVKNRMIRYRLDTPERGVLNFVEDTVREPRDGGSFTQRWIRTMWRIVFLLPERLPTAGHL